MIFNESYKCLTFKIAWGLLDFMVTTEGLYILSFCINIL